MDLNLFEKNALIVISVFLVILSTAVLSGSLSGHIIGVPSSCVSKLNINAPESMELYPGEMDSFEVTIYNVSCGVSYVRLELYAIEDDWYDVSPTSIGVISPSDTKSFIVYLDLPFDSELKTYSTPYRIYTNEGIFTLGNFDLTIVEPGKPKEDVSIQISAGEDSEQIKRNMPFSENAKFWYGVAMIASIFAIVLIGTELFGRLERFEQATKTRTGVELSKKLGKKADKKKDFEKALKKNK